MRSLRIVAGVLALALGASAAYTVKPGDTLSGIAARLGVAQPTVAKMLKRLACEGLVSQRPYRGVFLTEEGVKMARDSRERHQIVETFLLSLGVSPRTARIDAEGIEHHVSIETVEALRRLVEGKR